MILTLMLLSTLNREFGFYFPEMGFAHPPKWYLEKVPYAHPRFCPVWKWQYCQWFPEMNPGPNFGSFWATALFSVSPGFRKPILNCQYFGTVITILQTSQFLMVHKLEKNLGGARNLAPDPGARNFPIFITPKKFTSFYSKDFLPKLIFLRKGVHHPKFRFSGVVAKFPGFRDFCDPPKLWFRNFLHHLVLFAKL